MGLVGSIKRFFNPKKAKQQKELFDNLLKDCNIKAIIEKIEDGELSLYSDKVYDHKYRSNALFESKQDQTFSKKFEQLALKSLDDKINEISNAENNNDKEGLLKNINQLSYAIKSFPESKDYARHKINQIGDTVRNLAHSHLDDVCEIVVPNTVLAPEFYSDGKNSQKIFNAMQSNSILAGKEFDEELADAFVDNMREKDADYGMNKMFAKIKAGEAIKTLGSELINPMIRNADMITREERKDLPLGYIEQNDSYLSDSLVEKAIMDSNVSVKNEGAPYLSQEERLSRNQIIKNSMSAFVQGKTPSCIVGYNKDGVPQVTNSFIAAVKNGAENYYKTDYTTLEKWCGQIVRGEVKFEEIPDNIIGDDRYTADIISAYQTRMRDNVVLRAKEMGLTKSDTFPEELEKAIMDNLRKINARIIYRKEMYLMKNNTNKVNNLKSLSDSVMGDL